MILVLQNLITFLLGFVLAGILCFIIKKNQKSGLTKFTHTKSIITQNDLQALYAIKIKFKNESKWDKHDDRFCLPGNKQSLFCIVAIAIKENTGSYSHRGVVAQEIRFTIMSDFPDRWSEHPIMDFNNHADTTYKDILFVLDKTINRLENRYTMQEKLNRT